MYTIHICQSQGSQVANLILYSSEAQVFLGRVVERYRLHAQVADWEAHAWIYRRLSFVIMHGVAEQFVGRMSDDFGW